MYLLSLYWPGSKTQCTTQNIWSYCREKYTDLASVRNETERQQILSSARSYGYYYGTIWIGLHRNRLWSDQSSSSFTYWLPYTPSLQGSQHCTAVSVQYSGQWTDERCFASLPFFCYTWKIYQSLRLKSL
uniref:C-type lectin domain-containing protein n=1 Tax=Cyprinus carpio TaxID=7962 RepID=A0A8C2B1L2_CYPCA